MIETTFLEPNRDAEVEISLKGEILNNEIRQQLEAINAESTQADGKPVFVGYDVARDLDFREWPLVDSCPDKTFPDGIINIPENRIRVVSEKGGKLVHACFEKVYDSIGSDNLNDIARTAEVRPFKWKVTHRYHDWEFCACPTAKLTPMIGENHSQLYHPECGRYRESKVQGDFGAHVASLGIGMNDDEFNGYYPTIPGNDVAHHNPGAPGMDAHRGGKIIYGSARLNNQDQIIETPKEVRGGTEIRGGKAEYRQKTKGLITWDSGTQKALDHQKAQATAERKARNRVFLEKALNKGPVKPFEV